MSMTFAKQHIRRRAGRPHDQLSAASIPDDALLRRPYRLMLVMKQAATSIDDISLCARLLLLTEALHICNVTWLYSPAFCANFTAGTR